MFNILQVHSKNCRIALIFEAGIFFATRQMYTVHRSSVHMLDSQLIKIQFNVALDNKMGKCDETADITMHDVIKWKII